MSGILYFGGHSYEVIKAPLNWSDANSNAVANGGYLAEISSKGENAAIFKFLQQDMKSWPQHYVAPDGGNAEYVWIGGNDIATEGKWVWSDGSKVTYTNWGYGGEPDNFHDQDGMAFGLDDWPSPGGGLGKAGQWNDVAVNNGLYSLIEADQLLGTSGKDEITGTNKANIFFGSGGNDTLKGLGGSDHIQGGNGADSLFGGSGADFFVYEFGSESTSAVSDTIHDFSQKQHDRIDLSDLIKSQFEFVGTKAFSDHVPEVRYEIAHASTTVFIDTDGNGKANMVIHLEGAIHLQAADFLL